MSPDVQVIDFKNPYDKAKFLDSGATRDALDPRVRELGVRFAKGRNPNDYEGVVRDIHRFVRDSIQYVPDPFFEEFLDSPAILERGADDCDGKSRLFCALCRSIGIECRIRPVFSGADFVHVQAEARWPGSQYHAYAQDGGWILAELILKDVELGEDPMVKGLVDPVTKRFIVS